MFTKFNQFLTPNKSMSMKLVVQFGSVSIDQFLEAHTEMLKGSKHRHIFQQSDNILYRFCNPLLCHLFSWCSTILRPSR